MEKIEQQPAPERCTWEVDYTGKLPDGVTVSSATASAVYYDTSTAVNSILVSTTATVVSPKVFFTVYQLVSEQKYTVTVTSTLSNGDIRYKKLLFHCVDGL